MTQTGKVIRGALYALIAMLGVALNDTHLRQLLSPLFFSCGGILLAGLTAVRAYIDDSNAQKPVAKDTQP